MPTALSPALNEYLGGLQEVDPALGELARSIFELVPENEREEFLNMIIIFDEIHKHVNNPKTREGIENAAKEKAKLLESLAKDLLKERIEKGDPINVEQIDIIHQETNVITHNVLITLGDPTTGPNTVIEVHHDVIFKDNYDLSFSDDALKGSTICDNTIHLTATLMGLNSIKIPETGAVTIVFTDFEENGCRGSTAIAPVLIDRISIRHPVAFVALESTDGNLGIGHRGKLNAKIETAEEKSVANKFIEFYRILDGVQTQIYHESDESILGPTTGTATFGEISNTSSTIKLDFRTGNESPAMIRNLWNGLSEYPLQEAEAHEEILERAKKLLTEELNKTFSIKIDEDGLEITSNSQLRHPSVFNPNENRTVLPIVYLAVMALMSNLNNEAINQIQWGDEKSQNSNPVFARIDFDTTGITLDRIIEMMLGLDIDSTILNYKSDCSALAINSENSLETGEVECPNDESGKQVVENITEELAKASEKPDLKTISLPFMTDIAMVFNIAKLAVEPNQVFGFIYGIGKQANLHGVEEITPEEFVNIFRVMKKLPNIIQGDISQIVDK